MSHPPFALKPFQPTLIIPFMSTTTNSDSSLLDLEIYPRKSNSEDDFLTFFGDDNVDENYSTEKYDDEKNPVHPKEITTPIIRRFIDNYTEPTISSNPPWTDDYLDNSNNIDKNYFEKFLSEELLN